MDFSFNEEQEDLKGLVTQIFEGELTHERLKEVEGGDENFDRELWAKLAEAGVLGIALPEDVGGGGYGFLEAAHRARAGRPHRRAGAVPRDGRARRAARSRSSGRPSSARRCCPVSPPARRC